MNRCTTWLLLLLTVSLSLYSPGHALSETAPASAQVPAAAPAPPVYPGVAEVIPQLSKLTEAASQAEAKIASLSETASFEGQLKTIRERQEELTRRLTELGDPAGWSVDRLLEIRQRLSERRSNQKKLLDAISARLADVEALRQEWQGKKEFWKGWEASLKDPALKVPRDAFRKQRSLVEGILEKAASVSAPLVTLQREVTALQEKSLEEFNRIEATLNALRGEVFKKTSHSFANLEYYRQFNAELWAALKSGAAGIQGIDREFFKEQWWVLLLQVMMVFALSGFIRHYRQQSGATAEWKFLLEHSWATGVFVAVLSFSFLYTRLPSLGRFVLWVLAVYSAAVLISGLLRNPRKIFMVYLLASLTLFSLALQIISLPHPIYRLYLALLALLGIPVLLILAANNVRAHRGKTDGFTMALRLGAVILLVSFIAQVGGYSTLSSRLIESSIKSVFLGLFAAMALRLGRGGIDFLLGQEILNRYRFFRRHGGEVAVRLKRVFQFLVIVYACFYVTEVWGFFDTLGQAWDALMSLGVTVGETNVTFEMVFWALLVLYLSIEVSWLTRALLDAEVFQHTGYDRGVRDAIKKLLHYSLIFVGFLLAVTLAGVDLQAFAFIAGALGIGIGFGLQNIVNNFVSGLILLFERPIKAGDMVVIDNEWGTVRKIGMRSTIVETLDQSEIIVPNSQLISEKVTNWTLSTKVARIVVPVGVAYGSDVPLVLRILLETGTGHPEALPDPPPSPIFVGFGDSSLDFELRVWINDISKRLRIRSEIVQEIDRRFREAGVEIPFPQRDLHLRSVDGKATLRVSREEEKG